MVVNSDQYCELSVRICTYIEVQVVFTIVCVIPQVARPNPAQSYMQNDKNI